MAVIDKLEAGGLVCRRRSAADRRHVYVHLTDDGRAVVEAVLPAHVAAITAAMSYLSPEELEEFSRLCRKLGRGDC